MPTNQTQEPIFRNTENAEAQRADVPALRFERRQSERFEAIGKVEAVRMGPVDTLFEPKVDLRLIDESVTGAGFGSQMPLAPGTQLDIHIGSASAPWKSGRVVRCIATNNGYHVGVEYDRRLAA